MNFWAEDLFEQRKEKLKRKTETSQNAEYTINAQSMIYVNRTQGGFYCKPGRLF
jgi:hypothetical protein